MGQIIQRWQEAADAMHRPRSRAAREIIREAQLASYQIDGAAVVAKRAMDHTADLIQFGTYLAGQVPSAAGLLGAIEAEFVGKAISVQRRLYRDGL